MGKITKTYLQGIDLVANIVNVLLLSSGVGNLHLDGGNPFHQTGQILLAM